MEYYPPGGLVSATDNNATKRAQYLGATGGSGGISYTGTLGTALTPSDGDRFILKFNVANGANCFITLNGVAKYFKKKVAASSYASFEGGEFAANDIAEFVFSSSEDAWILVSDHRLTPSDIPSTGKAFLASVSSFSLASNVKMRFGAASRNDSLFTVSGTYNETMTAVANCIVAVDFTVYEAGNSQICYPYIYVDGSPLGCQSGVEAQKVPTWSFVVPLNAGQTLEIYCYMPGSPGSMNFAASADAGKLRIGRLV